MSETLKYRIFSEQVRLLYRGKIRTVSLNYLAILIIGYIFYGHASPLPLFTWLLIVFVITTIRLRSAILESPYDKPFFDPKKKFNDFMVGSVLQGLAWGTGFTIFILVLPAIYQAMVFLLMTVTMGLSVVLYSPSRLIFFLFITTSAVPPVCVIILFGDSVEKTLGFLMAFVFILIAVGFQWNYGRLSKGLTYRYEREDLMESLIESNRKLEQTNLQLESVKHQLTTVSLTDELTGIPNRRYFNSQLNSEWQRAVRDSFPLSCIMLDIDHFKLYNDTYGHLKGDEVLKKVAKTISLQLKRPADFSARYGGEEFVVLLPDTSVNGALRIAENIREEINALEIPHESSNKGMLTISQGVACLVPEQGDNEECLTRLADKALYAAKEAGRDQIKSADSG